MSTDELEARFRAGSMPPPFDGPKAGSLLETTVNAPIDAFARVVTGLWMPWRGKSFDAAADEGRNVFTPGFRTMMRVFWPGHDDIRPFDADHFMTFRFRTWTGESTFTPGVEVLKIDYGVPDSPRFIIGSVLDEVVQTDEGRYLGQALLNWRNGMMRAAWFELRDEAIR